MRLEFKDSREGKYRKEPKTCALFEHEYKIPLADKVWKETADHVVNCLTVFFSSEVYKKILSLSKDQWLDLEKFSSFNFEGTKIFVVLDFSFRRNNSVFIYDWKTGKNKDTNSRQQLVCYGLYAFNNWKVDPHNIKTVEFNLSSGNITEIQMTEELFSSTQKHMRESIIEMQKFIEDSRSNTATEDRFDFVKEEEICKFCNFFKICPKWE
jgi:CRISPR/Cas system-associated exonuclease Cas4 (RecB family)